MAVGAGAGVGGALLILFALSNWSAPARLAAPPEPLVASAIPNPAPAPVAPAANPSDATAAELAKLRAELAAMKAAQESEPRPSDGAHPSPAPMPAALPEVGTAAATPAPAEADPEFKSVADLIDFVMPSIVRIDVTGSDRPGVGSGFVVDDVGTVVTNYHVVEDAIKAHATFSTKNMNAVAGFVAAYPERDIAILRLEIDRPTRPLKVVSGLLRQGEKIAAFGCPKRHEFTVSDGIVSAVRTGAEVDEISLELVGWKRSVEFGYSTELRWLQFTAPVSPGNSGGPLVDMRGRVVGAVTWCSSEGQNLYFAVSSPEFIDLLPGEGAKIRPLSELPRRKPAPALAAAPESPPPPAMRPTADPDVAVVEKSRALRSIYERATQLRNEKSTAELLVVDVNRNLTVAQGELTRLQSLGQTHVEAVAMIDDKIRRLQDQANFLADPVQKRQVQSEIDLLRTEANSHRMSYARLDAEAAKTNVIVSGLSRELTAHQGKITRLYAQADQLRNEWLGIVDPFGERGRKADEQTLAVLAEWIALDAEYPLAYTSRADVLARLGRITEAEADLAKAKSLAGNGDALVWACIGYAMHRLGENRGIIELNQAVGAGPSPFVLWLRGSALLHQREYTRALADLKRAAKLSAPPQAYADLSLILSASPRGSMRQPNIALDHARKACELTNSQDWRSLAALANALAATGSIEEAKATITKAVQLTEGDAPAELQEWSQSLMNGQTFTLPAEEK